MKFSSSLATALAACGLFASSVFAEDSQAPPVRNMVPRGADIAHGKTSNVKPRLKNMSANILYRSPSSI
jgi:hypothetical protein